MADINIRIKAMVGEARQAIASVKRELAGIAPAAKQADSGSNFGKTKAGLESISSQLANTKKQLVGLFVGLPAIGSLKQLAQLAETAKVLDARIKIAVKSSYEFAQAQAQVRQISLSTGTALEANVGLFQKLRVNAKMAQGDAIKLTEIIAKATQLDGGGAGAQAAIFQLQQGLASGTLRGEELNSVLEQTPSLAKAIADGLGLSISKMRELAADGGLTADKVKQALFKMSDDISATYEQLPLTAGRAFENIRTNAIQKLGELDKAAGITEKLAIGLQLIADNMGIVVKLLAGAFILAVQAAIVAGGRWAASIIAQQVAAIRATTTNYAYMTSIAGVGRAATVSAGSVGRLTIAAGLLRNALALVGGPIGVLVTTLLSLGFYLYEKFSNAKSGIDQTREAVEKLQASLGKVNDQVTAATSAVRAQYDAAIERVKESTKAVEDSYKSQTAVIEAELQRRLAVIDTETKAEQQDAAKRLQAIIETEQKKREAIAESSMQTLATWQRTYDSLLAAAKATSDKSRESEQKIRDLEKEAAEEKLRLIQQYEQAYRGTVDRLIVEEQRLLEEVRQRGIERANLQKSVEEIIRGLRRGAMDEYAAYQDKNAEIDQKQAEMRRLIAKGDMESLVQAQKLAEEAIRAAQANSSEVTRAVERDGKMVTETVVSKQQAVDKSIREVQESARLAAEAMRKMDEQQLASAKTVHQEADNAKTMMEALGIEADQTRQALESINNIHYEKLESALKEVQRLAQANEISIKLQADMEALTAQLEELAKYPDRLPTLKPQIELSADNLRAQMAALGETAAENGIELPVGINLDDIRRDLSDFQTEAMNQLSIETASTHTVASNVRDVEAEISSLNGRDTTSTHTVVTRHVSANNAGGMPVARFATGGVVGFPRMTSGVVPGTGNQDSVPRTLQAGAFVLRKAAVAKYGLSNIKNVLRFATGGSVSKRRLGVAEALKLLELGREGMIEYFRGLRNTVGKHNVGSNALNKSLEMQDAEAKHDRQWLQSIAGKSDLTSAEQSRLEQIKSKWFNYMRQPLAVNGPDLEKKLISFKKRFKNFATGGHSEDTVPAMLTPGEVVVNRGTVKRLGLGFFHALNSLKAPQRILGFNKGGIVPGAPIPDVGQSPVAKVVNVKLTLPNGQSRTVQTVGDTDGNLLDALRIAGLSAS